MRDWILAAAILLASVAFGTEPATAPSAQSQFVAARNSHEAAVKTASQSTDDPASALAAADEKYVMDLNAAWETAMANHDADLVKTIDKEMQAAWEARELHTAQADVAYAKAHSNHLVSRARTMVFIVDASEASTTELPNIRVVLRKAILSLRESQSFSVIVFQGNGILECDTGLTPTTWASIDKAFDLLESTVPKGDAHPEKALEAAFARHPELIFVLTAGRFANDQAVLDAIHRLDADGSVHVNTIGWLQRGDAHEALLKRMAADTRGAFRYVADWGASTKPAATAP
jgi:hypothetical protein